jgi:Tfp pilus assembly protein PilP
MRFVNTLALGITLAAAGSGLHAQTNPASSAAATTATHATGKSVPQSAKPADKTAAQTPAKPAAAPTSAAQNKTAASEPATQSKPAAPAANKPAASATKPAAPKMSAKPAAGQSGKSSAPSAKASSRQASKPARKATARKPVTTASSSAPAADKETKIAKRDPFESLVGKEQGGKQGPLPPGKAGLQVGTLRLDGIVRAPNGMIAVVSNPQSRTYFLREGDQLYDGRVEKIAMDGVSFHEVGKDAFGKPVERQVNKRIYASAGEQQ